MKIAVFSDTHGFSRGMINAVEEYKPDQIIHLGDGMNDAEMLRARNVSADTGVLRSRQLRRIL